MCLKTCRPFGPHITVDVWASKFQVPAFGAFGSTYLTTKWVGASGQLHQSLYKPGYVYGAGKRADHNGIHVFPGGVPDEAGIAPRLKHPHKIWLAVSKVSTLLCTASSGHVTAQTYSVVSCETCLEVMLSAQVQKVVSAVQPLFEAQLALAVTRAEQRMAELLTATTAKLVEQGAEFVVERVMRALKDALGPTSATILTLLATQQSADTATPKLATLWKAGSQ